jgi:predicted dehydrogenase
MPPYQKLKELIDLKKFGKLKYLFLSRYSGTPDWGQWKEKQIAGASGGALMDLLIHDIDFTNYLLGAPDSIQSGSLPGRLSEQDYVNALWTYNEKNIKVRIEGGSIFHSQYPFQCGYTAVFEDATVIYHSHDGEAIKIADNRSLKEIPVESLMEGYKLELDYFARCMEQSTPPAECLPQSFMESLILACRHF